MVLLHFLPMSYPMRTITLLLIATILSLTACGDTANNLNPNNLQCPDPATIEPEDCEIDPGGLNFAEDVYVVCSSPCNSVRTILYRGNMPLASQNPFIRIKETGSFSVNSHSNTVDFTPLRSLEVIRGRVDLETSGIVSVDGLENVREIDGYVEIESTNLVELDLASLEIVKDVQSIRIFNNKKLKRIKGFNKLTSVDGVVIFGNPALETIEGFNALNNTQLGVRDNPKLRTLKGFASFKNIVALSIRENPKLPTCQAQAIVDNADPTPPKQILIQNNDDAAACP